jgi:hypothetical protein
MLRSLFVVRPGAHIATLDARGGDSIQLQRFGGYAGYMLRPLNIEHVSLLGQYSDCLERVDWAPYADVQLDRLVGPHHAPIPYGSSDYVQQHGTPRPALVLMK